jgi:hypothetical protein
MGKPFMFVRKLYRVLLWVQGVYTALTALWGLLDIDSFMAVTGPKTDVWLVKTVSAVLLAIGLTLISLALVRSHPLPAIVLGGLTSTGLAIIDFYYSGHRVISPVYALDGVVEVLISLCWFYLLIQRKRLQKA